MISAFDIGGPAPMTPQRAGEELVARLAKAIRHTRCEIPTYPWQVFDQGEAEANIQEWCKAAARAALSALEAPHPQQERAEGDVAELIRELRDEWERLSGHSINRGSAEAGIAANLLDKAIGAIESLSRRADERGQL